MTINLFELVNLECEVISLTYLSRMPEYIQRTIVLQILSQHYNLTAKKVSLRSVPLGFTDLPLKL